MKTFVLHVFCAAIVRRFETICVNLQLQNHNGSVAQLNRASDSGSEGRGFESHRNHQGVQLSQLHLFCYRLLNYRAERLGREKVLKVVGLNPTGITRGCSCLNCTSFIRRVWHPCHTHAALVSAVCCTFLFQSRKTWSRKSSEGRGFESHRNHHGGAVVSTAPFILGVVV